MSSGGLNLAALKPAFLADRPLLPNRPRTDEQVLGLVGSVRKRMLMLWQAVELSKTMHISNARILEVARSVADARGRQSDGGQAHAAEGRARRDVPTAVLCRHPRSPQQPLCSRKALEPPPRHTDPVAGPEPWGGHAAVLAPAGSSLWPLVSPSRWEAAWGAGWEGGGLHDEFGRASESCDARRGRSSCPGHHFPPPPNASPAPTTSPPLWNIERYAPGVWRRCWALRYSRKSTRRCGRRQPCCCGITRRSCLPRGSRACWSTSRPPPPRSWMHRGERDGDWPRGFASIAVHAERQGSRHAQAGAGLVRERFKRVCPRASALIPSCTCARTRARTHMHTRALPRTAVSEGCGVGRALRPCYACWRPGRWPRGCSPSRWARRTARGPPQKAGCFCTTRLRPLAAAPTPRRRRGRCSGWRASLPPWKWKCPTPLLSASRCVGEAVCGQRGRGVPLRLGFQRGGDSLP